MLIGRERELRPVATLLDEARRGRSGTLAIVGEPGVGKTTLLGEARRLAADMRLVAATGVESESELPFASLHELLRPLLGLLPDIPAAQARALAAALALEEGDADTLAVGAGTLSLLVEAAEEQPVLVLLDDAHWLDRASVEALVFAARRLQAEQLAVLAAFRPGTEPALDPLPRLELGPLAPEDARRLLRTRTDPVAAADEARVLTAAAGNPLALLELPLELARELPSSSTPHARLRRTFSVRLEGLPDHSRRGLLLAAAEPDMTTVQRAAEAVGLRDPLAAAEAAGLIRIREGSVGFRHPIVRSLVYADASAAERVAAHRSLADALLAEADRDRRAWHLAAASLGLDEEVAALLEQTAERAIARGGHAAGARALERAARLSPDRADRARRLYAASRSEYWGGDATRARALAEEALPLADDPLLHADLLHQVHAVGEWAGAGLPEKVFLQELERAEGLDDEHQATLLYAIVKQRLDAFDAAGAAALAPKLEKYARGAGPWWRPRTLAGAAAAYLLAGERERAIALFRELTAHPAMPAGFAFDYMSLEWYDASDVARRDAARGTRRRQSAAHRLEPELRGPPRASARASARGCRRGRRGDPARRGAWGAGARRSRLGSTRDRSGLARRSGGVHDQRAPRRRRGSCSGRPLQRGSGAPGARPPCSGNGSAGRHGGRARAAGTALAAEHGGRAHGRAVRARPGRGIRAVGGDRRGAPAARALRAARSGRRGHLDARCVRPLRGTPCPVGEFEPAFARGLELLESSPHALELARTRLAYGERLRRAGRRREARTQLQAAHDAFAAVGATPWQERTADELRATGVRVSAESRPRSI